MFVVSQTILRRRWNTSCSFFCECFSIYFPPAGDSDDALLLISGLPQGLPTSQHPVIVIKTADPRHLRYLVSFCYTGTVTLHAHDLQQVLQVSLLLYTTLFSRCSSVSLLSYFILPVSIHCFLFLLSKFIHISLQQVFPSYSLSTHTPSPCNWYQHYLLHWLLFIFTLYISIFSTLPLLPSLLFYALHTFFLYF